jgi:ubiquinone biosynthesis protein COQ9
MMAQKKSSKDEVALKRAILDAALDHVPQDGFSGTTLAQAGKEAGIGAEMLLHLFPDGPASLVEFYSGQNDAEMERLLAREKLLQMKVRDRIATAVLTRLEILKPHKEAARRGAAFLMLPMNAALGAKLLYRTVDTMWRAAGDTSTDFNFYTKRGILAGVYSATLLRWFNDAAENEATTREFLSARVENVMRFEKFKAEMRERTKNLPSFADVLKGFNARRS